jgi:hypothetical protein
MLGLRVKCLLSQEIGSSFKQKKKIVKPPEIMGLRRRSSSGEKLRSSSRKKMIWRSCSRTLEKISSRTMRLLGLVTFLFIGNQGK